MATTGILLRRDTKANLIAEPPVIGEMVFATDTGEHGWLNESSVLVWKDLTIDNDTLPDADTVIAPSGVLPTLDGSNLTGIPDTDTLPDADTVIAPAGVLPVLDGSALTGIVDADTVIAPSGVLPVLDGSALTNLPSSGGGPLTFSQLTAINIGEADYNYELFGFNYTDGQELSIRYNIISKGAGQDNKVTFNGLFTIPGSLLTLATDTDPVSTNVFLENGRGEDQNFVYDYESENLMWKIKKVDDGTAVIYLNSSNGNCEILVVYDILETNLATPTALYYAAGG